MDPVPAPSPRAIPTFVGYRGDRNAGRWDIWLARAAAQQEKRGQAGGKTEQNHEQGADADEGPETRRPEAQQEPEPQPDPAGQQVPL